MLNLVVSLFLLLPFANAEKPVITEEAQISDKYLLLFASTQKETSPEAKLVFSRLKEMEGQPIAGKKSTYLIPGNSWIRLSGQYDLKALASASQKKSPAGKTLMANMAKDIAQEYLKLGADVKKYSFVLIILDTDVDLTYLSVDFGNKDQSVCIKSYKKTATTPESD